MPPSLTGMRHGDTLRPHVAGWGFNPGPGEAPGTTPRPLLGAPAGQGASDTAPLGAATPAAGGAGATPMPTGLYPWLDPADAVDALLRSPDPGGVLEDLLQATSVRRGHAVAASGIPPPLLGSCPGFDVPGAGLDAALPELGSPRLGAPIARSGGAEPHGEGCKGSAPAVGAHLLAGADAKAQPSLALAGQPADASPAKVQAGAAASHAATAAQSSSVKGSGSGSQPERRGWGSPQALPLLSPAEPSSGGGSGQDPDPGTDPDGGSPAAWAEAWAAGAAGAQGFGGGVGPGEDAWRGAGQGPDLFGFQTLRGSLESARSLSPGLESKFARALAEVSAAPSPTGDPPAGLALGSRVGSADLAAAQGEASAGFSPAEDPSEVWAGANTGGATPEVQSMPWQGAAGSVGGPGERATAGDDTLSAEQVEALGSGPGSPAPLLRRSLEAALSAASRGTDPNPVANLEPAPGSPDPAERSGAGPPLRFRPGPEALFSLPSPLLGRLGSVGDPLAAERYSPAGERTPIGAGAGLARAAYGTPGAAAGAHASANGRGPGGAGLGLWLGSGFAGSGSPVAAPLSPATVQRHMRTYNNSIALADAEDEAKDLEPGSPGGRGGASGGHSRPSLGQGWRAAFGEDGGSAREGAGGV